MAFTKLSTVRASTHAAGETQQDPKSDIWTIFRALRDVRSLFGLRPNHMQTLQAMMSLLKPGQGETVFASNYTICQRANGIDERTLRRHINRFVELGFIKRNDSTNGKRYRVRSSDGATISYGLSLAPLMARAAELISTAQQADEERRNRVFIRKQILTKLAQLEEHDIENPFIQCARKMLRRKLNLTEYRALLEEVANECDGLSTAVDAPEPTKLTANDGQTDRHQSKSYKKDNNREASGLERPKLNPELLTTICDEAMSFSEAPLKTWNDIEAHARTLAPMIGIQTPIFERAKRRVGAKMAATAIFIILEMGPKIQNFNAYFQSITLGKRQSQFDPVKLLERMAGAKLQNI